MSMDQCLPVRQVMSFLEMGYGFSVLAKLFGISMMRVISKSCNSHKIFVRGLRHMEKPCKIINIFLIMGPKIRYVTHR